MFKIFTNRCFYSSIALAIAIDCLAMAVGLSIALVANSIGGTEIEVIYRILCVLVLITVIASGIVVSIGDNRE